MKTLVRKLFFRENGILHREREGYLKSKDGFNSSFSVSANGKSDKILFFISDFQNQSEASFFAFFSQLPNFPKTSSNNSTATSLNGSMHGI
jgi:hypothetical protein